MVELHATLRKIYKGSSKEALRAQNALLAFEIAVVAFFVATTFVAKYPWIIIVDVVLGVVLIVDFAARGYVERDRLAYLMHPVTLTDLVVIASLLASAFGANMAFLRVLRTLRLLRSYHLLRQLRRRSSFFRANEDAIVSTVNLAVFIMVVTAAVYVLQVNVNPEIVNYVDALYFTIAALTTTGFGDITLVGSTGRLLAVVIMIVGVALFIRLVQTIFRPRKVAFRCPDCGLSRHDADAVHCKHCGRVVNIENEGDD